MNQRVSPTETAKRLRELGFPEVFAEIVLGQHNKYGADLALYFERPREFYRLLAKNPDDFPFSQSLVPRRESNSDFFICYAPPPENIFIEHSIEWRSHQYRVIAGSFQDYLEYELERLWSCDVAEVDVRTIAAIFGYQPIDDFLERCKHE